jgi:hypothetical protein
MYEQQAWAQGGGSIPLDHNQTSNEVQSITQVETNVESQRRLVHEDICRMIEQQVERQVRNFPQTSKVMGIFQQQGNKRIQE